MKGLLVCFALLASMVAQADLGIFAGSLENGWVDYSWATVSYTNSAFPYNGTHSVSVTAGPNQALYLHHDPLVANHYTSLSFWINGGTTGGQHLQVQATLGGAAATAYQLAPLAANTWTHYSITIPTLGIAGHNDFDGFWIQDTTGASSPTFYVDDISLVEPAAPNPILVTVDASHPSELVDMRMFGVNTAIWDSALYTPTTTSYLKTAGIRYLRFPGGSASDTYHWATNTSTGGSPGNTNFAQFAATAIASDCQSIITTNYGTGTASEAAGWVRQANVTLRLGIKNWEVGNEVYGTWETDSHAVKNDPYTYAQQYVLYRNAMKAVDPTIQVGAVIPEGEDTFENNTTHYAKNPRTGLSYNGFAPVMLATLKSLGTAPDFVVYHYYAQNPGNESDEDLLNSNPNWQNDIPQIRQMLVDYLGASVAKNVTIQITENNSVSYNPGKQSTSLVNALYLAESWGYAAETEAKGFIWWDLRNGQDTTQNNSPSLYGWRLYGDYGIVSPANDRYPVYYAEKILQYFARYNDAMVPVNSGYYRLAVFGCKRLNGHVTLMVVNKSPTSTYTARFTLSGFTPSATATTYSYGIPQDNAAKTSVGSPDISTGSATGLAGTFTRSFAPYSITVIDMAPAPPVTGLPRK